MDTKKIEIKFSELDEFFIEDCFKTDLEDVPGCETQCEYWLGEIGTKFDEIYGLAGISIDWYNKKLIIESSWLDSKHSTDDFKMNMAIGSVTTKMGLTSEWITRSYDDGRHPFEEDAGKVHQLGGDDDVDYCSGYIDAVISALENYSKKYSKKEG